MPKYSLEPEDETFYRNLPQLCILTVEEIEWMRSIHVRSVLIDTDAQTWEIFADNNGPVPLTEQLRAVAVRMEECYELKKVSFHLEHDAALATLAQGSAHKEGGSDATTLIYGKKITQAARAMREVTEEENDVVVEGSLVATEIKELRTGSVLILIQVADATDGLTLKMRFGGSDRYGSKGEEEVRSLAANMKDAQDLCAELKKAGNLRIQGNVAVDTYENNELVMNRVKGIMALPRDAEREDKAPVKRVELHCHTMMSELDGITPIPALVEKAVNWGHPALAITDHGVVQAFPFAQKALDELKSKRSKKGLNTELKLIFGMEGYLWSGKAGEGNHHIILLACNKEGLSNLYKLVSFSHLAYYGSRGGRSPKRPRLTKNLINEYRAGLLIGSACSAGELYSAILAGRSEEELKEIASFYDYLEIQPTGNNDYLIRDERYSTIKSVEDLQAINKKIYALGQSLGKLTVATCDVHYLNPEDSLARAILQAAQHYNDADKQAPIYYRTTEEMLSECSYFGAEIAEQLVVTNPQKIAAMVEVFKPVPDDDQLYAPTIPGAEDKIKTLVYAKAHAWYGETLPQIVEDRLKLELTSIIGNGFAVLYYIAHLLVKKSNDDGYMVGSRGSVGSSFVATLLNITEVNPLEPHYRCPQCLYSEFITDGSVGSGFDLPEKTCPHCGAKLIRDGQEIPFAVFLGFKGDKVPDIDLNFSGEYQAKAHKYTEVLFGRDNVCRAGTIGTMAEKTAYAYIKKYYEEKGISVRNAFINSLVPKLVGVKRTTGQHAGGIVVIPRNMDIHHFTPEQHPANDASSGIQTTHYDFHSFNDRVVKLDILGHDDPTMIKRLDGYLGFDTRTIPFGDEATMSIFRSTKALGVKAAAIGSKVGTYGIPECGTHFVRQMLLEVQPRSFSDLLRISGYSHGTDVWNNNAQDLLKKGLPTEETISTRDDIMTYLINKGVAPKTAFDIMEACRKGKAHKNGLSAEQMEAMHQAHVPEAYIESCHKVQYLFPKAHATAYVINAYRIAYCKVHHPEAFYAAYFGIRAPKFDYNIVRQGKEHIKQVIADIEARSHQKKATDNEEDMLTYLELVVEMLERGYRFAPMDLYKSHVANFLITPAGLVPPLWALNGVGDSAALAIDRARSTGEEFTSVEDLKKRSGISSAAIEAMREAGMLQGMDESAQQSLF